MHHAWNKLELVSDRWTPSLAGTLRLNRAANLTLIEQGRWRYEWKGSMRVAGPDSLLWFPAGSRVVHQHKHSVERLTIHLRHGAWASAHEADSEAVQLIQRLDSATQDNCLLRCKTHTKQQVLATLASMRHAWQQPDAPWHRSMLKGSMLTILACLNADPLISKAAQNHTQTENRLLLLSKIEPALQMMGKRSIIADPDIRIIDLAQACGYSPSRFHACFVAAMGISPLRYITQQRIHYACELLQNPDLTIVSIAFTCGFNSQSRFYAAFTETVGTAPGRWRRQQY